MGLGAWASESFEDYRAYPAYVVLGEPGAGKTTLFQKEAEACDGYYVSARDFPLCDSATIDGRIVFIDGLDERRAAGGGQRAIDEVRAHLVHLGKPRFRLSCREADWFGASDEKSLKAIAPGGEVVVLHLEPLTDSDVGEFLAHEGVQDPAGFVVKAERNRLEPLLRNPQTLKLLATAVRKGWPKTRAQVFERACRELVVELNEEHQAAAAAGAQVSVDALLDAAGYLCAVMLLAGKRTYFRIGVTSVDADSERIPLSELVNPEQLPLERALKTNLFTYAYDADDVDRTYIHRSVAEYLAGRFLARRIEKRGLSVRRVLAACTGEDQGVVTDLRGLCAWLAASSPKARAALIDSDPLGVVLYGDVSAFPTTNKQHLLRALKREAEIYPGFRSEDRASAPFGGLGTEDMYTDIAVALRAPVGTDAEQVHLDGVLDAVQHGEPMPKLRPLLLAIVRGGTYWERVRITAMEALEQVSPDATKDLLGLLKGIHDGTIEDREDQLMAHLLGRLYPREIPPEVIFDYLHKRKSENLIGDYYHFWTPDLTQLAPKDDLPTLLEEIIRRRSLFAAEADSLMLRSLMGEVLASTLEAHGDDAEDGLLFHWLSLGRDTSHLDRLDDDERTRISEWLSARPERHKAMVREAVDACRGPKVAEKIRLVSPPTYDTAAPADMVEWYFTNASAESDPHIAEHYFNQGMFALMRRQTEPLGDAFLLEAESWVARHPKFAPWYQPFVSRSLGTWEQEHWKHDQEHKKRREAATVRIVEPLRKQEAKLWDGTAPPGMMHQLSWAYLGRYREARGNTPLERLSSFVGDDQSLVDAALNCLDRTLDRTDLPAVADIVASHLKGNYHFVREPALVSMDLRYETDTKRALALPQGLLERVCAFWLTSRSEERKWLKPLMKDRPEAMAAAMLAYLPACIAARQEHVSGVWALGYEPAYAKVARLVVAPLLAAFPVRSTPAVIERYLPRLLYAARQYMPQADLARMVASKLATSLDPAQRLCWMACGALVDAKRYLARLARYVRGSKARRTQLADFLHSQNPEKVTEGSLSLEMSLSEDALVELIRIIGPDAVSGHVTHDLSRLVQYLINALEGRGTISALNHLQALLGEPKLRTWHNYFRASAKAIRVARRKLSSETPSPHDASVMLASDSPASAADLAAVVVDELRGLAYKIRNAQTNDYKQYWDGDGPKKENDCRDVLLSQLQERLGRYGAEGALANKEGHVALDQRADIMVSYGARYEIPVEVKRGNYRKNGETVWTAIRSQLSERYTLYPNAHGNGIYVVFWFGADGVPPSGAGMRPRSAAELEEALRAGLTPSDGRIRVVVIDCTRPTVRSSAKKKRKASLSTARGPKRRTAKNKSGVRKVAMKKPRGTS